MTGPLTGAILCMVNPTQEVTIMKLTGICLAVLALTFYAPGVVHACSCASLTPTEALEAADAVFAGKVISVDEITNESGRTVRRATVHVQQIWKGLLGGPTLVDTEPVGSCTFTLFTDQRYLVYAFRNLEGVRGYSTHECNRTTLYRDAQKDLEELGNPIVIVAELSTWGRIKAMYEAE